MVSAIVMNYVYLIRKGLKTIEEVPEKIREDVRTALTEMDKKEKKSFYDFLIKNFKGGLYHGYGVCLFSYSWFENF